MFKTKKEKGLAITKHITDRVLFIIVCIIITGCSNPIEPEKTDSVYTSSKITFSLYDSQLTRTSSIWGDGTTLEYSHSSFYEGNNIQVKIKQHNEEYYRLYIGALLKDNTLFLYTQYKTNIGTHYMITSIIE